MRDIRIGTAQFEHRNGDKAYNLSRIRELTAQAVQQGAEVVSFHECCISAYTFVQTHSKQQLWDLAEEVPSGPSTQELICIAAEYQVAVLAGLFEREGDKIYNTYVCCTGDGLIARFRKLHTFVSQYLTPGSEYCVFDLYGCKCGILICYDNNLVENVRINALLGAKIIFMPHVTGCLPSVMPGRGTVDRALWDNRERDPVRLRQEFQGPKNRGWLMRWLPARAYDNGVYAVFTNPVGMDDDTVKGGNSMILDPFGEVLCECNALGDEVQVGFCTADKIGISSGQRYLKARRTDMYGKLVETPAEPPVTAPGWTLKR